MLVLLLLLTGPAVSPVAADLVDAFLADHSVDDLVVLLSLAPWSVLLSVVAVVGGTVAAAAAVLIVVGPAPRRRTVVHAAHTAHVVEGPVRRDGVWLRLVEFPDGRRRVEFLGPQHWTPYDAPGAPRLSSDPSAPPAAWTSMLVAKTG
jgi:hypothetical protein